MSVPRMHLTIHKIAFRRNLNFWVEFIHALKTKKIAKEIPHLLALLGQRVTNFHFWVLPGVVGVDGREVCVLG